MSLSSDAGGAGSDAPQPDARLAKNDTLALLALLTLVFTTVVVLMQGLSFPMYEDEVDYWIQTQEFVADWPPSLELLRSYGEPMTPLSFLYWGALEKSFGGGLPMMRAACLVLSIATLLIIGRGARKPQRRGLLCVVGLLVYPYWVPFSVLIYTDMLAVSLVVFGLWLFTRGRGNASAVAFILAIATRQYMVTVPAALLAAEFMLAVSSRGALHWGRLLPPAIATLSLVGWAVFFGGLGPSAGMEAYPTHLQAMETFVPVYSLYFLTCIGVYFVIPEFVIFRRWREPWPFPLSRRNVIITGAVLLAYVIFPPPADNIVMGPINRVFLTLLPFESWPLLSETTRIVVFTGLASLTCTRFRHFDILFWLILSRCLMMTVVWEGWEKYHVVLVASLWYLRSISDFSRPLDLFGMDAKPEGETQKN
jgi:hypothetical protein